MVGGRSESTGPRPDQSLTGIRNLIEVEADREVQRGCDDLIKSWTAENVLAKQDLSTGCGTTTKVIGWIVLVIITLVLLYLKMSPVFTDPTIWDTNEDAPDEVKNTRQTNRGTCASIIVALIFGLLNGYVDATGEVDPSTSTALFGMLLGGSIGYLADIGLGSDTGLRVFQEEGKRAGWKYMFRAGWKYMFGKVATGSFIRYQLTILFDTFVSLILFKPLFEWMLTMPFFKCPGYSSVANAILSTIISSVTFDAYTNQTRFLWAYPDVNSKSKSSWIKGSTMLLATTIMSLVFLGTNTIIGYNPHKIASGLGSNLDTVALHDCYRDGGGLNSPKVKLVIVLVLLAMLTMMSANYFDTIEPRIGKKIKYVPVEELVGDEHAMVLDEFKRLADREKSDTEQHDTNDADVVEGFAAGEDEKAREHRDDVMSGLAVPVFEKDESILTVPEVQSRSRRGVMVFVVIILLACFGTYATSKHTSAWSKYLTPAFISGLLISMCLPALS